MRVNHLLRSTASVGAFALAIGFCCAGAAMADDAKPGDTGEIVVTANKTKEYASKVPISIVAYSTEALKQSGIKSIADIGKLAPGVQFDTSSGLSAGTQTNIAIRGVNSTIGTSTTGIYIDDTPIQTRIASLSYWGNPYPVVFDLERVEIERGPQGTLFGAGAEGGAVRFITAEPSLTIFSGTVHAEASAIQGGGPGFEGGVAMGGPIVKDKLGFRLSVWDRREAGYIDRVNPFTGQTVDKNANRSNTFASRVALLYSPDETIKITPSFFTQIYHSNDVSTFYEKLGNPSAGIFKQGHLIAEPNTEYLYLPSLKVEAGLPHDLTVTSVSSYFVRNAHASPEGTGINGVIFGGYGNPLGDAYPTSSDNLGYERVKTNVKTFSQELRLSNASGSRLKWTMGAFYSRMIQTDYQQVYGPWTVNNVINPYLGANLDPNDPLLNSQIRQVDRQVAGFGQIDYKIVPNLTFTLGGRISSTTAGYSQVQSGFLSSTGSAAVAGDRGSQSATPWSGKAGLAWQVTPDDMLYASASRGFRMGGANQPISQTACGVSAPATYASDYLNSYEIGAKGKAGRLRFDVDAFHVDWFNIQQSLYLACAFGYIANAGKAVSNGFDASARFQVAPSLSVHAAVSYVDAHFTQTSYLPDGSGKLLVAAGDKVAGQGSAPWTITGGFDYDFAINAHKTVLHVEDSFKSHDGGMLPWLHPNASAYYPTWTPNPATNVLNARVTMTFDRLEVAAYVTNIINDHPVLYRYLDGETSTLPYAVTLTPRTFGLSVDYKL